MTMSTTAWAEQIYTPKVTQKFQAKGFRLKGTTQDAVEIKGDKCYWRIAGAIEAQLYQRGSAATPANGDRTKVNADMETWQVYDNVYDDDLEKMSVGELEVVTDSGAMAMGRRFDRQIFNAMATDAPAPAVTDTTNGLTLVNAMGLCEAGQVATDVVWDGGWFSALTPHLWNQMLAYKQFTSSDYIGSDLPLVKSTDTRFWNGVNWFLMPHNVANPYLPIPSAGNVDIFLWHKTAVGYGSNYQVKTNIAWDNSLTAFTANMRMAGQSKVILPEGVVRGRFTNSGAIVPN